MSQMLKEMLEQPSLLESRADTLFHQAKSALPAKRPEIIVLAARGSSDHACIYGKYLFEITASIPVILAAPSVITRYSARLRYPPCIIIGISQSAAAPDVAAIVSDGAKDGHTTISISNESGIVTESASKNIFLEAGEERAVAATKTFTLTLLALYQLARALGADLPVPRLRDAADEALKAAVSEAVEVAINSELLFALGRGYDFPVAMELALKLMECALIPCRAFSTADFAHGPIALASQTTGALVFAPAEDDETSNEVLNKIGEAGARLYQIPFNAMPTEELSSIPAAIFAQRIAFEAARRRGLDPDKPRNLQKVTRTE